jgi:hypothetical protein
MPAMTFPARPAAATARCPPWSRLGEAARLFAHGATLQAALPVAAVVGCVLSGINEGARIAAGDAAWPTWVQVGLNFVVPFLVSSYGYLAAARVPARGYQQRPG